MELTPGTAATTSDLDELGMSRWARERAEADGSLVRLRPGLYLVRDTGTGPAGATNSTGPGGFAGQGSTAGRDSTAGRYWAAGHNGSAGRSSTAGPYENRGPHGTTGPHETTGPHNSRGAGESAVTASASHAREADFLDRSLAIGRALRPGTVLSHQSALAVHGLPLVGLDLRTVTAARPGARSGTRRSGGVVTRGADLTGAVTESHGVPVTTAARAVSDVARSGALTGAVCAADEGLRSGIVTVDGLAVESQRVVGTRGASGVRALLDLVDPAAESVLESLSRVGMVCGGIERPESQVQLRLSSGRMVRPDFLWRRYRLIGECDGSGKYLLDGVADDAVTRRLRAERARQSELEAAGYRVVRWQWSDALHPESMCALIRAAMDLQTRAGFV